VSLVCPQCFWTLEDAPEKQEPVAMRYDFDGYGFKYIDSGSGSDWQTRIKGAEPLYTSPQTRKPLAKERIISILDCHFECVDSEYIKRAAKEIVAYGIKE
jgi:hypothetical protein